MSQLRLMSQNQWNCVENKPAWAEKGLDCSAKERMKGHIRVLKDLAPDVLGGQEVNAEMQKYFKFYCLEEHLPYAMIWGHYTPIMYRPDKLELLDTDYLPYPEKVEGLEGRFNDALSKSLNLGVFRTKEDGKVFLFANTHLWWMNGQNKDASDYRPGSDEVRTMQVKMAMERIALYQQKYGGCPVFFVGDMNTDYHAEAIQTAIKAGFLHAHDIAVEHRDEGRGYHWCSGSGFGPWQDLPFPTAIDHILVKDAPEGTVRRFERYTPEYYLTLSDHAPVYVDIVL